MDLGLNFNDGQWLTILVTAVAITFEVGKYKGILITLDYLEEKKMLDLEDEDLWSNLREYELEIPEDETTI